MLINATAGSRQQVVVKIVERSIVKSRYNRLMISCYCNYEFSNILILPKCDKRNTGNLPTLQKLPLGQLYRDNYYPKQGKLIHWFKEIFNGNTAEGQLSQSIWEAYNHIHHDIMSRPNASGRRHIKKLPKPESTLCQ